VYEVKLMHLLFCRLQSAISHPDNKTVVSMRAARLAEAAAAFPRLGGEILPHLLQPLQEHRYTTHQLVEALRNLPVASPRPPTRPSNATTASSQRSPVSSFGSVANF
jgi:hypothetical protein